MSELFTASESSIGNSGGITLVRINEHSRNNLYLLRDSSSLPKNKKLIKNLYNKEQIKAMQDHKLYNETKINRFNTFNP